MIGSDQKPALFIQLLRIRMIELEIAKKYLEFEMRCPTHLSIGQEAVAVAISAHLKHEDKVFSAHRSHAHYLAKGGSLNALVSEMYGKATGCSRGHGGSMHLIDLSQNFIGATSIVGGTVPVAVGSALAAKMQGLDHIVVSYFGDSALETGVLHEAMNFASLKKLPIIFVCENNGYSCFTPMNLRQPNRPIINLPLAQEIKSSSHQGNNVFELSHEFQKIVKYVREGNGPYFIEAKVYRQYEHCGPLIDDDLGYRAESEIKSGLENDCLDIARKNLNEDLVINDIWENKQRDLIGEEIAQAFQFALNSPIPELSELGNVTYAQ